MPSTIIFGRTSCGCSDLRTNLFGFWLMSIKLLCTVLFRQNRNDGYCSGSRPHSSCLSSSGIFPGIRGFYLSEVLWRRGFYLPEGRWSSCAIRLYRTGASIRKHDHVPIKGPLSGKANVEKLWREFLSDPSQWWDNRLEKVNRKFPDFYHKKTHEGLWLDNKLTPAWVEPELAAVAPGTLQSDIFSWNKRIERCVKAGRCEKAIGLFQQMELEGMEPDTFTFVQVLNACAKLRVLEQGIYIHRKIIKAGHESNDFVGNCLVDMYAKCGRIDAARRVFDEMPARGVVAWSAMIGGYVQCRKWQEALELSRQMEQEGVDPNPVTFLGLLNACACLTALEEGKLVHEQIIRKGYESDLFLGSSLVHMYAKCGSIEDARRVFNAMPRRDVVTWGTMLLGYVKCGHGQKALELFRQMQQDGVDPDRVIFLGLLNACASLGALEEGRRVHQQIIKRGYEVDAYVGNCLVDMYAKCGSIDHARKVFDQMIKRDVVAWGAMLTGFVNCGEGQVALKLYQRMLREGVQPDSVIFVAMLSACASLGALEEGRHIHEQIIKRDYDLDVYIGNSLVAMYAKCGCLEDAVRVFDKMPTKDLVAWNAMLGGYVNCGQGREALELWRRMQQEGIDPNPVTFVGLLNACAGLGVLDEGRRVHEQIIKRGDELDIHVGKCLIAMYSKCGSIEDAREVFNTMPTKDRATWNSMFAGYGAHGYALEALEHFERMLKFVDVDGITFVFLLSACSHAGLVDEGICYFESMSEVFNISSTLENYACVVDLLGRAGHLHEAEDMIKTMHCEPGASVWTSLLSACRLHGNMEMGERVVKRVLESEPKNAVGYVLLSNMHAVAVEPDKRANVMTRVRTSG